MNLRRSVVSLLATLSFAAPTHALEPPLPIIPLATSIRLPETLPKSGARLGAALAGDDQVLVAGAPSANEARGGVVFLPRKDGDWLSNGETPPKPATISWGIKPFAHPKSGQPTQVPWGARLGTAVAIDKTSGIIAVGAPGGTIAYDESTEQSIAIQRGAVYLFRDTQNDDPTLRFPLVGIIEGPAESAHFGEALAFRDGILAVGAPSTGKLPALEGRAYVYEITLAGDVASESLLSMFVHPNRGLGPNPQLFGGSLSLTTGDDGAMRLAVGHRQPHPEVRENDFTGSNPVFVYQTNSNDPRAWVVGPKTLNPEDDQLNIPSFGFSLLFTTLSSGEQLLLIGAPYADQNAGLIQPYVQDTSSGDWLTSPGSGYTAPVAVTGLERAYYYGYTMAGHDRQLMLGSPIYEDQSAPGSRYGVSIVYGALTDLSSPPTTRALFGRDDHYTKAVALTDTYAAAGLPIARDIYDRDENLELDAGLIAYDAVSGGVITGDLLNAVRPQGNIRGAGQLTRVMALSPERMAAIYTTYGAEYTYADSTLMLFGKRDEGDAGWNVLDHRTIPFGDSYPANMPNTTRVLDGLLTFDREAGKLQHLPILDTTFGTQRALTFKEALPSGAASFSAFGAFAAGAEGEGLVIFGAGFDASASVQIFERQGDQLAEVTVEFTDIFMLVSRLAIRPGVAVVDTDTGMFILRRIGAAQPGGSPVWRKIAALPPSAVGDSAQGPTMALHDRWLFVQHRDSFDQPVELCWYDLEAGDETSILNSRACLEGEVAALAQGEQLGSAMAVGQSGQTLYVANGSEVLIFPIDNGGLRTADVRTAPLGDQTLSALSAPQLDAVGNTIWAIRKGIDPERRTVVSAPVGIRIESPSAVSAFDPSEGDDPQYPILRGTAAPRVSAEIFSKYEGLGAPDKMEIGDVVAWELINEQGQVIATTNDDGSWRARPTMPLAGGVHQVAFTFDPGGPLQSNPAPVTIRVELGTLMITSPTDGQLLVSNPPVIEGIAPAGVVVEVVLDGKTYTATADAAGVWTVQPGEPLPVGEHTIIARATIRGEEIKTEVKVEVEREVELVDVEALDGATITTLTPTFTGGAAAGEVISCKINDRPALTGITPNDKGTWYYAPATELEPGPNQLIIDITPPPGQTKLPPRTISFTVDLNTKRPPLSKQRCTISDAPRTPAPADLLWLMPGALIVLRRTRRRAR